MSVCLIFFLSLICLSQLPPVGTTDMGNKESVEFAATSQNDRCTLLTSKPSVAPIKLAMRNSISMEPGQG